ncbi:MAG: hypothetical protein RLZZ44_1344, partial [Bacteroidota bacterium]
MKKVLIINLPKFDIDCPPLAPAILQSIAKSLNYETKFVDLNLELTEKSK